MRVVIIGAGIGGLCLAQGLVRAGIETVVYERDPGVDSRRQGYRIHLDGRGALALHACLPPELYELFLATMSRPSRQTTVVSRQLRTLHTVRGSDPDLSSPATVSAGVDRAVLRSVMLCGLQDVVRFGKEFERYETGPDGSVTAHFADGGRDHGDLLVAADGVGSRIRGQYLPHAVVRDTGGRTLYGRTPLTDEVRAQLPPTMWEGFTAVVGSRSLGMALGLVDFREPPAEAAARLRPGAAVRDCAPYAMWALSGEARAFPGDARMRALDSAGLHAVATSLVRRWHPDLRALVRHADVAGTFYLAVRTSERIDPWPATAVTLLGDAIHAMSPSRGSGANIALKDAALLCTELTAAARGGHPPADAVAGYEAEMVDYGFTAVSDSLALARRSGGVAGALASLATRLRNR
ncbi:FAD-dependent oxidoreductase [Streptacidiphilus sp. EB129]|uniref:FAD-dependent oxidoreductase n=1 Tax=Streptacidiphilus sp. EB129 TaxID=3156262 RepID=UPI003515B5F4